MHTPPYGHNTSNVSESFNFILKADRELPILELFDQIWHRNMQSRSDRLREAERLLCNGRLYTPLLEDIIPMGRSHAQNNTCQVLSFTAGRVVQSNGLICIVDTAERKCSCGCHQENDVPCRHALTLLSQLGLAITPYLQEALTTQHWRSQYLASLPPVNIADLEPVAEYRCEPPPMRIPRGWPKKECVREEDVRKPRGRHEERDHGGLLPLGAAVVAAPDVVRLRCSTCGDSGHNKRTYKVPHQ